MANLSREDYLELIRICSDKAFAEVAAAELVFAWPGNRKSIQRSDAFIVAAVFAASLRLHYELSTMESADSTLGECLKQRVRGYELYAPGMLAALRNYSITDEIRDCIRNAMVGFRFSQDEKSKLILTIYATLALWATVTIFPAEDLMQGAQSQVNIMSAFARRFDDYFLAWRESINHRGGFCP